MSQAKLLGQRSFWPFFLVAFLGAFNDNLFKNALVMMVTFGGLSVAGIEPGLLVPLSTGLIILPFVLFSATSGQLSDHYAKSRVIRWVKLAEIPIMLLGAVGLWLQSTPILLTVLFLTGLQSTVFSPTKYSYLPEVLPEEELVGGNALIEMGTFLAILLGTIAGGVLITSGVIEGYDATGLPTTHIDPSALATLAGAVIVVAALGLGAAWLVPKTTPANPELRIRLNPIPTTREIARETLANRSVLWSVIGISWFWFIGAALLALMPGLGEDVLKASPGVVTWFLALFCVGIGIGSLLVEKLGEGHLELGLVPIGAAGMTLFAGDVFWAAEAMGTDAARIGLMDFLRTFSGVRLSLDLLLLAGCGGLFTVPLYTMMQTRSEAEVRSRIVAGCNLLNAIFMVISAGVTTGLLAAQVSIPTIFLIVAGLNIVAIAIICWVIPEFVLKMIIWLLVHTVYRLTIRDAERIPVKGRAVVVANHPSFIDFMFLVSASRRPMRFVVWHTFYHKPSMNWLFRAGNAIPIASYKEDPEVLEAAYDAISDALKEDEVVCIFPEGTVSRDGGLSPFRGGVERILERDPAPVIPVAIMGMWGSFFSREGRGPFSEPFKRFWSRITVQVGEALATEEATADRLAREIAMMGGWEVPEENQEGDDGA